MKKLGIGLVRVKDGSAPVIAFAQDDGEQPIACVLWGDEALRIADQLRAVYHDLHAGKYGAIAPPPADHEPGEECDEQWRARS